MEPSGCGVRWSVYLGVSIGHWEEFGVENFSLNQSLPQPRTFLTSTSWKKLRRSDPVLMQYKEHGLRYENVKPVWISSLRFLGQGSPSENRDGIHAQTI
jgi:hypothetical protein